MYEKNLRNGVVYFIIRLSDMAWIPVNPDNSDYIEFLNYLTANNLTIDDIPEYQG